MLDSILLSIAKSAILSKFDSKYISDKSSLIGDYPYLSKNGACFITLHKNKELRGCIGSIIAHRSLYDDIVSNAISAAFSDPRFNPLTEDEYSDLLLEVSLLSEPEILEYRDLSDLVLKVKPNIDGVIIKYGAYQATFLPQVWEQLQSPESFLEHLAMKAGLDPSIYSQHPTIYTYNVEHVEEKFDEVLSL